jgi:hypothetical protein
MQVEAMTYHKRRKLAAGYDLGLGFQMALSRMIGATWVGV